MSIKATQPEDSAEREAFEAEFRPRYPRASDWEQAIGYPPGTPNNFELMAAWHAWQKRAALATPSPQPAEAVQAEPVAHLRAEANMFNGYGACHKDDVNAFPVYRSAKAEPAEAKTAAVDGMTDADNPPRHWVHIDRSYGQRAKAIIAFNTCTGDLDDKLDAAWRAAIATQEGGRE